MRRRSRLRELSVLFTLTLVALGTWLWLERVRRPATEATALAQVNEPDSFFRDFVATRMDVSGHPLHRIEAQRLDHFPLTDTAEVVNPQVTIFRPGEEPWRVTARRGLIETKTERLILIGDVLMQHRGANNQELHVRTSNLLLATVEQFAQTDEQVDVEHSTTTVHGVGLRADLRQGRYSLLDEVIGRYLPASKGKIK